MDRRQRHWEFDALRGLMLVLMTATHLPTRLSSPLGQPFGFVSAAEGFVLLSGFMAGMVYTARERREGPAALHVALWRRALQVYACQAGLLAFLLTVVALIGVLTEQPAINNMLGFYREQPAVGWLAGLLLIYAPPLLDILPMYVLFLLASPLVLLVGLRHGWGMVMAVSVLLWLAAQFGASEWVYGAFAAGIGLPVPFQDTGAFDSMAWQFLWVLGLWLGAQRVTPGTPSLEVPRVVLGAAWAVALTGLAWRHGVGQVPFPDHASLNALFSKWQVGPLRLLNLFALMLLAIHYRDALLRRLPRLPALETLGRASLPVFCAHLVLVLLALAVLGEPDAARPWSWDLALLGLSLVALHAVARFSLERDAVRALGRRLAQGR